ncbi:MAG: TonB-dependent receptor, partial [Planctomycetes bacterium]|nr:TonB-dependent receptor [Planctomycetota bacterium]
QGFEPGDAAGGGFDEGRLLDGELTPTVRFRLSGDYHRGKIGEQLQQMSLTAPYQFTRRTHDRFETENLVARIEGTNEFGAPRWSLQTFADRYQAETDGVHVSFDTLDVEFRSFFELGEAHAFVWGLGYRRRTDRTGSSFRAAWTPRSRDTDKYSFFVQDTVTLTEALFVMGGVKVEKNEYSGWEYQPSIRGTWSFADHQTVWAAVSRSVSTPSRTDENVTAVVTVIPPPPAAIPVTIQGDPRVGSEKIYSFEVGYRVQPQEALTGEWTVFYNRHEDLLTNVMSGPTTIALDNEGRADTFGTEVALTAQVRDGWRLRGAYGWLKMDIRGGDETPERDSPEHSANLRSELDLTSDVELNTAVYYVDHLRTSDIGSYFRVDAGLSWRPREGIELSVWGQNLTESHHAESLDTFWIQRAIDVPRTVYAQLLVQF